MQIDITGHQMEITAALRQHVEDSLAKINHLTDGVIGKVHVVLEASKQRHSCSMSIHIGNDAYSAKDESDNMYHAIDRVNDKIRRQMSKSKTRQKDRRHH